MDAMRLSAKQLWRAALERVHERVSAASYTTWFKSTEGWEYGPGELVVAASNSFATGHLEQRFRDLARACVADVVGRTLEVRFVVRPNGAQRPDSDPGSARQMEPPQPPSSASGNSARGWNGGTSRPTTTARPPRARRYDRAEPLAPARPPARGSRTGATPLGALGQPPLIGPGAAGPAPLDHRTPDQPPPPPVQPVTSGTLAISEAERPPRGASAPSASGTFSADPAGRHVFENFIVGTTNRLAHAAALQVAGAPGESYNPLFIYGGTGLGKTHLLLAIGHEARRKGLSVCYVPAERFANDIIEAIRHHTTEQFRARYRQVDVLLVDDIQFIAGKESTEEEFFHTFNALHETNRQIVLSSDRVPRAMRHLHDRLRSRFEWGLLADIHPPDPEHRMAILRAKAATLGVRIDDRLLEAIAQPDCASVRELEGALNRVLAYASMLGAPVDDEVVARALGPLRTAAPREVTPERVLVAVSHQFGLTVDALRGKARDHAVAWPRQVAMYVMREMTAHSLSQIGECLGGRDHTTVMHGCTRVASELKANAHLRQEVDDLMATLRS